MSTAPESRNGAAVERRCRGALEQFRLLREAAAAPRYCINTARRCGRRAIPGGDRRFLKRPRAEPRIAGGILWFGSGPETICGRRANGPRTQPRRSQSGNEALARGAISLRARIGRKGHRRRRRLGRGLLSARLRAVVRGDRDPPRRHLDEALRLNPAAADVYSFRGMMHRETGDLARARRMFERAIALDPRVPCRYCRSGTVFLRQGRLDRAVGQFEAGLNLVRRRKPARPRPRDSRNCGGRSPGNRNRRKRIERSAVCSASRERKLPGHCRFSRNRSGFVRMMPNRRIISAWSMCRRAKKRRRSPLFATPSACVPDYADAHQNLGAVLTTSDAAEAVRELETALELQPRLLKAQFNLALAYEASPRHGPASRRSSNCESCWPPIPLIRAPNSSSGRLLFRQGKPRTPWSISRLPSSRSPDSARRGISSGWRSRARAGPDEGD